MKRYRIIASPDLVENGMIRFFSTGLVESRVTLCTIDSDRIRIDSRHSRRPRLLWRVDPSGHNPPFHRRVSSPNPRPTYYPPLRTPLYPTSTCTSQRAQHGASVMAIDIGRATIAPLCAPSPSAHNYHRRIIERCQEHTLRSQKSPWDRDHATRQVTSRTLDASENTHLLQARSLHQCPHKGTTGARLYWHIGLSTARSHWLGHETTHACQTGRTTKK